MGSPGRTADSFEERVRAQEEAWLSPLAVLSFDTRGRLVPEEPCSVRTPFQRDRLRFAKQPPEALACPGSLQARAGILRAVTVDADHCAESGQ